MNNKYTPTQKQAVLEQFTNGTPAATIVAETGIARSTIYAWIKSEKEAVGKKKVSLQDIRWLEKKVERLEGIIEILQRVDCLTRDPLDMKLAAIEITSV